MIHVYTVATSTLFTRLMVSTRPYTGARATKTSASSASSVAKALHTDLHDNKLRAGSANAPPARTVDHAS